MLQVKVMEMEVVSTRSNDGSEVTIVKHQLTERISVSNVPVKNLDQTKANLNEIIDNINDCNNNTNKHGDIKWNHYAGFILLNVNAIKSNKLNATVVGKKGVNNQGMIVLEQKQIILIPYQKIKLKFNKCELESKLGVVINVIQVLFVQHQNLFVMIVEKTMIAMHLVVIVLNLLSGVFLIYVEQATQQLILLMKIGIESLYNAVPFPAFVFLTFCFFALVDMIGIFLSFAYVYCIRTSLNWNTSTTCSILN